MSKSQNPSGKSNITPKSNITSDSVGGSAGYVRPAGGNAAGVDVGGRPIDAPAGVTPGYSISMTGNAPGADGTQVGANIGHGATQIGPTGDRPSGGVPDPRSGTAGPSGPGLGQ